VGLYVPYLALLYATAIILMFGLADCGYGGDLAAELPGSAVALGLALSLPSWLGLILGMAALTGPAGRATWIAIVGHSVVCLVVAVVFVMLGG
jgi:hypothetical protein